MTLTVEGTAVSKAISVAEIVKRRLRGLHQSTQIGLAADNTERSTPTMSITLSLAPLDARRPGYQPPLTEEELRAAWIFDEGDAADITDAHGDGGEAGPLLPPGGAARASATAAGSGEVVAGRRTRSRKRRRGTATLSEHDHEQAQAAGQTLSQTGPVEGEAAMQV